LFIEFSQTINLRTPGGIRIPPCLGGLLQRTAEQLEGRERVEKKVAHNSQPADKPSDTRCEYVNTVVTSDHSSPQSEQIRIDGIGASVGG
jgi:hypothetical protein